MTFPKVISNSSWKMELQDRLSPAQYQCTHTHKHTLSHNLICLVSGCECVCVRA